MLSSVRHSNRLIAALNDDDYSVLLPHLQEIQLPFSQVLCVPSEPLESLYFPIDAVCSVMVKTKDERVEVGLIGNEGVIGGALALGMESVPFEVVCHISGRAIRIGASDFKRCILQAGALSQVILVYLQRLFFQVAQHLACTKVHLSEERIALWLLMIQDRAQKNEFYLTQELLSEMLSIRRESVSRAAKLFQNAGLIDYSRGNVIIRNRKGLEDNACECYRLIRGEPEQAMPGVF